MFKRLTGTCVLGLGVLAFAGSAFAGNGNGNGNGGGKPSPSEASPGNSSSAPGQAKKDAPPAPEQSTTTVPGQTAAESEGVKPSSETAHDTRAAASSNQTKQYGNGQTAGKIAVRNGAAASTILHGPGNSQPHKAAPCSGGHEVDVHALKGRRAGNCGGTPPHPSPAPSPPAETTPPTKEQKSGARSGSDPAATGTTSGHAASSSGSAGGSEGALAAPQRFGRAGSLPFTGAPLWPVVLFGLMLIAAGLALRQIRTSEASVESGHDRPNGARHATRGSRAPVGGRTGG